MGFPSLLEDLQKSIDNLEHLASFSAPPSETSVRAQERRLAKEQQRLKEAAATMLRVASALRESLDDPAYADIRSVLEVSRSKKKRDLLERQIQDLEREIGKLLRLRASAHRAVDFLEDRLDQVSRLPDFELQNANRMLLKNEVRRFLTSGIEQIVQESKLVADLRENVTVLQESLGETKSNCKLQKKEIKQLKALLRTKLGRSEQP
jgi:hypothetical protein